MKIKIPSNMHATSSSISLYTRVIVKSDNKTGWDIADLLAKANGIDVPKLGKMADMNVCSDHIMLDVKCLDDNTLVSIA